MRNDRGSDGLLGTKVMRAVLPILAVGVTIQFAFIGWERWRASSDDDTRLVHVDVGWQFPSLWLVSSSGQDTLVRLSDLAPCTSILFFTPTCPACIESADDWAEDFSRAGPRPAIAIGLTTIDSARVFVKAHSLEVPVFAESSRQSLGNAAGVYSIPKVVQIGDAGTVIRVIRGGPYQQRDLDHLDRCDPSVVGR